MYKLYRKNPDNFALIWIGIYCLVQSLANGLSSGIGIPKSANAVLALAQSCYMLYWLHKYHLLQAFQLNKPKQSARNMLFYLPLVFISTSNLWLGVNSKAAALDLGIHILLMLNVGFLEELIFRGFLFEALRKKSLPMAITVSSLTFGLGHILNLFNGSGMSLGAVMLQMFLAVLFGFLYVTVYLSSGSLIPCILSHQCINILSVFANVQAPARSHLAVNLTEIAVILLYLFFLVRKNGETFRNSYSREHGENGGDFVSQR